LKNENLANVKFMNDQLARENKDLQNKTDVITSQLKELNKR
jgi:hypothetical protein